MQPTRTRIRFLFMSVLVAVFCLGTARGEVPRLARESGVSGGVAVVLGGDADLAAQLRQDGRWLVHVLTADTARRDAVRAEMKERGLYGRVSAEVLRGPGLPYRSRSVAVLVLAGAVPEVSDLEVRRVVRPGGCIIRRGGDGWQVERKAWPDTIDTWTHFLHGADGNPVSGDLEVAEPKGAAWVAGPRFHRFHSTMAGLTGMVTDNGRIFSVSDEGPVADYSAPRQWWLVARDAFSGVELWRREMPKWFMESRSFRTGPAYLTRPLVVDGDRVFVTLSFRGKVHVLDAATGETVRVLDQTEGAQEFVYRDGILYIVCGRQYEGEPKRRTKIELVDPTWLMAVEVQTGEVLWSKEGEDWELILPLTTCASGDALVVHTKGKMFCLEQRTGAVRWSVPRKSFQVRKSWSTPTVSIVKDVVLVADESEVNFGREPKQEDVERVAPEWMGRTKAPNECWGDTGTLTAYSVRDGEPLWQTACGAGFSSPTDVFYADGLVWVGAVQARAAHDFTEGRDLHTGEVKRTLDTEDVFPQLHHHRCYRAKATDRFIVMGRQGTELIDLSGKGQSDRNTWVRGTCQYGVMPANGMIYAPPHYCGCYPEALLAGHWALAPRSAEPKTPFAGERLQHYGAPQTTAAEAGPTDWPTYRHDAQRTGTTPAEAGSVSALAWELPFAGGLSAPSIVGDRVYVSEQETHTVHAVSLDQGELLWSYTAGAPVDSPPTFHAGRLYFGSVDGHVYCLNAATGEPVWRFLAAPVDRRMVSYDRLESVWPVHGSVLVHEGAVWAAAGRSSYLDGGIRLWRLDPATGEVLSQGRVDHSGEEKPLIKGNRMVGAMNDILSAGNGPSVFMRHNQFDEQFNDMEDDWHIYSAKGFLDDSWFGRTYWVYGLRMWGEYKGWAAASYFVPHGRILSRLPDSSIVGFGRPASGWKLERTDKYFLYRESFDPQKAYESMTAGDGYNWKDRKAYKEYTERHWQKELPIWVRAMAVAGDAVVIAGPVAEPRMDADQVLAGEKGSRLMLVSRESGEVTNDIEMPAPPAWDGLAAVPGRIIISGIDGKLRCFSGQ